MAGVGSGCWRTAMEGTLYVAGTLDQAAVAPSTSFDVICLLSAFVLFLGSLPREERGHFFSSQVSSSGLGCLSGASRIISDGWLWVSNLIILSVASCLHLFFLEDTLLHPGLSTGGFQLPWCGASSHLCWMLETHNLMLFHCLSATSYFYFDIYKYIADFSFASKKWWIFISWWSLHPAVSYHFSEMYMSFPHTVWVSLYLLHLKKERTLGCPPYLSQPTIQLFLYQ